MSTAIKKTSWLKRLCYEVFFYSSITIFFLCLFFRDQLFLGSGLIVGRWIFLTLFIVLFFINRKRKWTLIICSLLLFSELIWSQTLKKTHRDISNPKKEVSVLSLNLLFINQRSQVIKTLIKNQSPDILLFQEFTNNWASSLNPVLEQKYPYKKLYPRKDAYGIATYSKFPITDYHFLEQYKTLPFTLITTIKIADKTIDVGNVHLESPAVALENTANFWSLIQTNHKNRQEEFYSIQEFLGPKKSDLQLIMGDFNTMTIEPLYRDICQSWVNAFDEVGKGNSATFPNTSKLSPFLKLDHAFLKGHFKLESIEVLEKTSSDHLPLFLKFSL